jgi:hypothetical protein
MNSFRLKMKIHILLVIGLVCMVGFVKDAKSFEELQVIIIQGLYTLPNVRVIHEDGATEGYDGANDSRLLESPNYPRINLYSRVNIPATNYKLKKDARDIRSRTTYNIEFEGVGLPEEGGVCQLTYWMNAGAFSGLNVITRVYTNDPNSFERIDDAKYIAKEFPYPTPAYAIWVFNGVSKRIDVEFYENIDINLDRKVDLADLALLSWNWGRTGVDSYSPMDLNSYADINRDGSVDINDLSSFVSQWLLDYRGSERSPESYLPPEPL